VRILLTTDVQGGVWSYTEELTEALTARGHEVALVSFGGEPRPEHRAWLATHPGLRFTALPHALEWMPEPEPSLSASVQALCEVVDAFAPDVLHLNQFFYGAYEWGAPKLVAAHSDVVGWWRAVKGEEPPDHPWFRRYRGWVRAGLAGAGVRVAPSAWMAAQAESIYGAGPSRVVHNARSPHRFARGTGVREAVAVSVGRLWDDGKGARDLAAAAQRLHASAPPRAPRSGPPFVVVAGAARHPAAGPNFPTDAPGLRWAGVLPSAEVTALLQRSTVYVATSRYEPFGLAPLEAALCGCALLMSDIPTFRELWDGAALFYPPGDTHTLAEILRELLADPVRSASLADAAHTRARERFLPDRMAAEYEAVYRQMLGEEKKSGDRRQESAAGRPAHPVPSTDD
jgi:glycogen synthase